jgi:hypothetical protein
MSSRMYMTVGITVAVLIFGGWRMLLPGADSASSDVSDGVSNMLTTVVKAQFTGAEASLDAQRTATGSYAGAAVAPPVVLVRADASTYCLQLTQGPELQHLNGPDGTPAAGAC